MISLNELVSKLDSEFQIKEYGKDTAFSKFIPQVYGSVNYNWSSVFEKDFCNLFNGLMLRGNPAINDVFLAVFPTDHVLERFIEESKEGDLLFMHHPLLMECGDPNGKWGKGFVPIKERFITRMLDKNLSVYTCHVPMDYHKRLGTSVAIVKALEAEIIDSFLTNTRGEDLVLVCNINKTNTEQLVSKLKEIFQIPYVDFEGQRLNEIQKIAIVAGCGDKVNWMEKAEEIGVQAYITGEIHCHIDNDYGKKRYNEMKAYSSITSMSLLGVSHSSSEYLVKKTLMKDWFESNFGITPV